MYILFFLTQIAYGQYDKQNDIEQIKKYAIEKS